MSSPLILRAKNHDLRFGSIPKVMGILNTAPNSFSDGGDYPTLDSQLRRCQELLNAGAEIIDIGGESGVTNEPQVKTEEELERVICLIERVVNEFDAIVSVDTYKPAVAQAAIEVGACIINDTSGLRDQKLASICAQTGAALVLMHTRGAPKQKVLDYPYRDVAEDVTSFLEERILLAKSCGVTSEQLILDPGPDFGKNPRQTIFALQAIQRLHQFDRPLLLAVSRKDFIGALTERRPSARLGGTLAAISWGLEAGVHILRVHDVGPVIDFLNVWSVLDGKREVPAKLKLSEALQREIRADRSNRTID